MKRDSGAARRWRYLAWGVALLLVLAAGCAVKKPQVPRAKFQISIPVADNHTEMSGLIPNPDSTGANTRGDTTRADYLKIDEAGRMSLDFTHEFGKSGRQEIGNRLSIKPNGADFSTAIGDIELPGASLPPVTIPMSQLVPGVAAGATVPVPATDINTVVPLKVENIELIAVKSGGIDITFRNGLPVDLANMRLILVDRGAEVSTIDLGQAPKGAAKSGSFELAGKSISGELTIRVTGSTVAADAATIGSASALEVQATLRPLVVTEADALIPQQEFADSQVLEFPDSRIQVTSAIIREGKLAFEVTNNIPLVMQLDLSLDDLKKPDGSANVFRIERLNENATVRAEFDLGGNKFAPENSLELRFSYAAKTIPSTEPAKIISGSTIGVKAITSTLAFSRVEGKLDRLSLPIPSTSKEIGFPDGLENIALSTTSLQVFMTSAVGFKSQLNLHLEGTNKSGTRQGTLDINAVIDRGDPQNPKQLVLGPSSTELTNFLNVLPAHLQVEPEVLLGDGVGTEVISDSDYVKMDRLVFKAPVSLRISADSQIRTDPQRRVFNDATARERITSNLDSAAVETVIESHLPIGVHVSLLVGTTPDQVFTSPILRIPHGKDSPVEPAPPPGFGVDAARVDAQGRVTESRIDTLRISIPKDDALVFLRPDGVYTGILIELDQTAAGSNVDVLGSDYVDVKVATQVFLELNDELVNGR